VILALIEVDPDGRGGVGLGQIQVVEQAEKAIHDFLVTREHVELGILSRSGSCRPVLVDEGGIGKSEFATGDLADLKHELLKLPGSQGRGFLGTGEADVVISAGSNLVVAELR